MKGKLETGVKKKIIYIKQYPTKWPRTILHADKLRSGKKRKNRT